MLGQEKSKNPRNTGLMLDMLHIVIGIAVVTLAVFAFLNPEGNQFLFPFIFICAAVLNGVNGMYRIRVSGREKKKRFAGIAILIVAIVLLVLSVLSAVSIWR